MQIDTLAFKVIPLPFYDAEKHVQQDTPELGENQVPKATDM